MKRLLRARVRLVGQTTDSGIALVTVIAITAVLGILVVSAIAFSMGGVRKAKDSQDWNAALAAAYAGVEEYMSQLANDQEYGRYGNPASSFTGRGPSLPPKANPAMELGASGAWAKVPGSDGSAWFRYEIDNSQLFESGKLKIRATGRVGNETRSVVADLKQRGFGDYVYFTDFETTDPYNSLSECARYAYDGRPPECPVIAFGRGDVIDGRVHSNDRIAIECGAKFESAITTAYRPTAGPTYDHRNGGCLPTFMAGAPQVTENFKMPATNSEMKKEVRFDLPNEVPNPGCLYTGPTSVKFIADGRMIVKSPWTQKVQISASSGRDNSACGTPGTGAGQLGHIDGAIVRVPTNNVIFVQNVPTVAGDPNFAEPAKIMTNGLTGDYAVACKGNDPQNTIGYPVVVDPRHPSYIEMPPRARPSSTPAYGCRSGDVFVEGELKGKVSVAAENYVYVVGDTTYADQDRDILGLVGQNAVIVANPINSSGNRLPGNECYTPRRIHASILSVAHTFMVQNTEYKSCSDTRPAAAGKLEVLGSIAQKFRGTVFYFGGYNKAYKYHARLQNVSPPKFLAPARIKFGVSTWSEINPVMKADGSYA